MHGALDFEQKKEPNRRAAAFISNPQTGA